MLARMRNTIAATLVGLLLGATLVPVTAQTRGDLEDRVAHLEIVVGKLKLDNETKGETIRRLCRKVGLQRCPIDGLAD